MALGLALLALLATSAAHAMDYRPEPTGLARDVLSEDPATARAAIEKLRATGPEGLGVLMDVYRRDISAHTGRAVACPNYSAQVFAVICPDPQPTALRLRQPALWASNPDAPIDPAERWKRLSAAIDAVAAQKDASFSGLYWYTDLDKAKAAAKASHKPILSLRLLGTLDTEFSCANSRFFRTVLYANADVSKALRDRFILHWQSVRPVPKVTIDMGDGRVICRTVTGNSIHYVLDGEGRPVDGIPGLYGPKAFLRELSDAEQLVGALAKVTDAGARQVVLTDWHTERASRLTQQWESDLASVTAGATPSVPVNTTFAPIKGTPTALQAARAATAKSAVELNIVRALAPRVAMLKASTTDEAWTKIAALPAHAEDAKLDDGSRALVRTKQPAAPQAGRLALAKRRVEDPLVRLVAHFERSVAEDTVRNEYGFHRAIHEWFAGRLPETAAADVAPLNEKVYAELFLTPSGDPWLGLVPSDAYSALEGDGVRASAN
jgi:hypothetical protein